ncbi:MAG TPA: hypothetical protein VEL07_19685 [Planctomycetota bacterium]|nr:hypothetical protein [Planctomycetota bacterium]
MSDVIAVKCDCGKKYNVRAESAGRRLRCKQCGAALTIPLQEPVAGVSDTSVDERSPPQASVVVPEQRHAPAPTPPEASEAVRERPAPREPRRRAAAAVAVADGGDFAPVDPDELLRPLADARFGRTFVIALVIFTVFVGVTSIGYVGLCVQYGTLMPMPRIEAERKAEEERKVEEQRQAALAKLQPVADPDAASATPRDEPAPAAPRRSKIERELEETSHEKPADRGLDLDGTVGLEEN